MHYLPIDEILPELMAAVREHSNVILHAPPGAGKTTRVPLALLDIIQPGAGRIIMLEPRRLAAVSAASWMANMVGQAVGQSVGYSIRFDSKTSPETRIEVVTEGVLTRRIQRDPLLEGVAMVIFDEFHERSIHADLGLALCLDIQRQVREDLKLLVMSATLDCEPLSKLMGHAPVVSSPGRSHVVEEIYLEAQGHARLPDRMAGAVLRALGDTKGDLLAFLPGSGEIRACARRLADAGLAEKGVAVYPLYGDMPFHEQQRAIQPGHQRRVVLATSIAETSLTIEGVRVVIDSGLSRRLRHDQASGMNRLVTVRESGSSAEQRKGRAGRVAPGVCYRLFSRHTHAAMTVHTPAEILDTDLSPLLLELTAWGVSDPRTLSWVDPPPDAALAVAAKLLTDLGALDSSARITRLGREMAKLPLHPRLARLLLRSVELGCLDLGCDLAALLSERDIVRRAAAADAVRVMDMGWRVRLLRRWRLSGECDSAADLFSLKAAVRVAGQLSRMMKTAGQGLSHVQDMDMIGRLLSSAYPDRIAKRREGGADRYLLANGRGARLLFVDTVSTSPLLVAVSVDGGGQGEGVIHLCCEVGEELLRDELAVMIEQRDSIVWDQREGRAVSVREECLGAVPLSARPFSPSPGELLPVVLKAVADSSLGLLSRDEAYLQLQSRVMLLRSAFPDAGWPDLSHGALLETLADWLAPAIGGMTTARQLLNLDLAAVLLGSMDYRQRRALDELAPTHLTVPSGSRIRLDYCEGELPVLAVKLQELFGLADTPAIAGGRVGVLLHLLSPAGRPLQVTRDLKGFWDGSYHQVRKEMKGRYPRHPWPDDPWNAVPTRRAKPRTV